VPIRSSEEFPFLCADLHVEKMRFEAVKCMARSYRPTVPVSFMARTLGFTDMSGGEGDLQGLEECEDWLRGHGSHVQIESGTNELVMDAKVYHVRGISKRWFLLWF
jgi:hypothetical protein